MRPSMHQQCCGGFEAARRRALLDSMCLRLTACALLVCLCVVLVFVLQVTSSQLDTKMRDDLERLKKIRNHRGLRHYWGLTVRGQHTKTTGRRGKTVGVKK